MDKELEERLVRLSQRLGEMLETSFHAFRRLTEESIKEVEKVKGEVRQDAAELTNYLVSGGSATGDGKEWIKPCVSIASSFERMSYNIEGIVERLKMMNHEEILFSDRAVRELNDIFQEAMDLLAILPDLIATRNKLLAQQIGEKVRVVFKMANSYCEEHEDRLIQGICMPKSSPSYLGTLESLKGVLTHILEVSGKIATLSAMA